ncbi:hypothetical protein OE88DRAFT_1664427 [Heliocybe sulcata]|uniref:F-box domain-containing protein n=1 Tax=Heliocybe sulcata TaxID=5364 RepID=A0A5C3MUP0_9AGAM|nr:hypothetical protein OE88DRAFT_1664427 [Heliocybe sulcata]
MHRALVVDEILRQIFKELYNHYDYVTLETMGNLSRCCKMWKEPALDQLWSKLPSFAPLLSLLPCSALDGARVTTVGCEPTVDDIRLFQSYAQRVRYLTCEPMSDSMVELLGEARRMTNSDCLLPGLVGFMGVAVTSGDIAQWSTIIGPNLQNVRVRISRNGGILRNCDAVADWLGQLLTTARRIETFEFRGCSSQRLNELFASMTMLRSVIINIGVRGKLSEAALASMATFPNLQSLRLKIGGLNAHAFRTALQENPDFKFPALEKLHIDAHNDSIIDCIVDHLPRNTLWCFHVDFQGRSTSRSISTILDKIARKTGDTLQHLTIQHGGDLDDAEHAQIDNSDPRIWTIDTVRPLARIKTLVNFALDTPAPPVLEQKDVEEILGWWPHVEHVHLATGAASNEEDTDLARSIAAQLETARGLKSLILPKVDANGKPFDVAALSRSPSPMTRSPSPTSCLDSD